MPDLTELTASEVVDGVRRRAVGVADIATAALRRIDEREPVVRAFAHLDPDRVRASAVALDRDRPAGPLLGLPVGIKDLFDTMDAPTEYGSPIYRGFRPIADADVVAGLRRAGALVVGKTVTTEFALFYPGKTTNPHHPGRTPGGSSSGSAAAVASGMVAAALGTQTAGSVIRPAAYCGVVGFKPTFGMLPRTGTKAISPSLDTVGLFARTAEDAELVWRALAADGDRPVVARRTFDAASRPRLGFVRPPEWDAALQSTRTAIEKLAGHLADLGCVVEERQPPGVFAELVPAQITVMEVEAAQCLQFEYAQHRGHLSETLVAFLERGQVISPAVYRAALATADVATAELGTLFGGLDGVLTPSVVGEAPVGLGSTGDPVFCRAWTLLGWPALNLPLLTGPAGLPLGVQLVGARHADADLLALGREVSRRYLQRLQAGAAVFR